MRGRTRGTALQVALHVTALLIAVFPASACKKDGPKEVLVAAAASLRGVMPDVVAAYAKEHPDGPRFVVTYGASGDLEKQVEGGAPVDVVVFASGAPVDELVKQKLADPATRTVIATNALVLIGPPGAARHTFATVDAVAPADKIAIGNPKTVPAGQYAETALRSLGKWDAVEPHLVLAGDVSAVLAYVRHGEVAEGIVYKTETHGIADVEVMDELSSANGTRPEVVAGVTTGSKDAADGRSFVTFLAGPASQALLRGFGFGAP
jgi:molybdate transport system substrate-binding protein